MKLSVNPVRLEGRGWVAAVLGLAALSLTMVISSPAAFADDQGQAARAARLSSVDGQVQLSQGSQVIADQAVANAPLFEGTRVVTGDNGRAEIQFEDGSVVRLSPNSSLVLTALHGQGSAGEAEIVLSSGLGYFELQGGQSGVLRIRFGDSQVTASGFSVLRINLDKPPGDLAVFSGNAHLERGSALAVDLHGGESVALSATDPAHFDMSESIEPDSWDTWNSDRDQVLTAEASSRTAATKGFADSSNPAWNDLDANGNWYNVPGQGNIWSPYEATNSGWDPYGNGNWMLTPVYGYVWASGNSWGFLPYQCGTWNFYDAFGWGWTPGMGGCAPWWGGGIYYGPNIGSVFGGYRPPLRPHPRQPIGHLGLVATRTIIPVNRRPIVGNTALPARDRSGPVMIAGQSVQPFRPISPRVQYERSASGFVNGAVPGTPSSRTGAGVPAIGGSAPGVSRPGFSPNSNGPRPLSSSGGGPHPSAPSRAPSGGGYSGGGASASHSSGGYSSGGGGGGGGGGGASHSGGGGGGGSHK